MRDKMSNKLNTRIWVAGLALMMALAGWTPFLQAQERPARAARPGGEANSTEPRKDDAKKEEPKSDKKEPKDEISETTNSVTINGVEVNYKATAGTLVMKDEEGKPHATVFFIAYTRLNGATNPSDRPITFSFNGGPGSSSVWLHLGVLGPRRVLLTDIGDLPPPPYRIADNQYSLLDVSDLVFIDPVSTGYSRPVSGEKAKEFHNLKKDVESV